MHKIVINEPHLTGGANEPQRPTAGKWARSMLCGRPKMKVFPGD